MSISTFHLLVENENHCDFTKLREMLIRTNMEDMRDTTHSKHYEVFRKHRLQEMGFSDTDKQSSFAEQYTMRRETHLTSLQQKEEEMRQKFVIRVKEKESELKEAEREVRYTIHIARTSNEPSSIEENTVQGYFCTLT